MKSRSACAVPTALCAGLIAGLVLSGRLAAQSVDTSRAAAFEVTAVRLTRTPVIDGRIDDGEWDGAAMVTGFIQYEPRRGSSFVSSPELFDAHLHWDPQESGRREVRVERERVADTLGPHECEAGGIDEAEIVVPIAVEDCERAPFHILADEEPLEARRRVE
jgi:hypothetical protein